MLTLAVGCLDGGTGLRDVGPVLKVTPDPIVFPGQTQAAGATRQVVLRNEGSARLVLLETPLLQASTGEFTWDGRLVPIDCRTGVERPGLASDRIDPGECLALEIAYRPVDTGPDEGSLLLHTNDRSSPKLQVPVRGDGVVPALTVCLPAGPCAEARRCARPGEAFEVTFPDLDLESDQRCALEVHNDGPGALASLEANVDGEEASSFELLPAAVPTRLEAGASIPLTVRFHPRVGGTNRALLRIGSDDPRGELLLDLFGRGDAPRLCPDPSHVDFGEVVVGEAAEASLTLRSCGLRPVAVEAWAMRDGNGVRESDAFSLETASHTPPFTLAPGEEAELVLSFVASRYGTVLGRFMVQSNDPAQRQMGVPLRAEAAFPPGCRLEPAAWTVSYGVVAPNETAERTVVLANVGDAPCTGLVAEIAGGEGRFRISQWPVDHFPFQMDPGDALSFRVAYHSDGRPDADVARLRLTGDIEAPVEVELVAWPDLSSGCHISIPTPIAEANPRSSCTDGTLLSRRQGTFGGVAVGATKVKRYEIHNVGPSACFIQRVRVQTDHATSPSERPYSLASPADRVLVDGIATSILPAGAVGTVEVRYRPGLAEPSCGLLEIVTDDGTEASECSDGTPGCRTIGLFGIGLDGEVLPAPEELDFGAVQVGCASTEATVSLYRSGVEPVQITALRVVPAGAFVFTSRPPLPAQLDPGAMMTLGLRYAPTGVGLDTATLEIETDPVVGVTPVMLYGQAVGSAARTEVYANGRSAAVDVLLVIDNSGSMSDDIARLQGSADRFMRRALELGLDFRVGLVTTDMFTAGQQGRLQSFPSGARWLDRTDPTPPATLSAALGSLPPGVGTERGIAAFMAALSEPLASTDNAGFRRPGAPLHIIVVSDEEDQSIETVDEAIEFLNNLPPDGATLHAVVGPMACGTGEEARRMRYEALASATGGGIYDLCTDFGAVADALSEGIFGALGGYPLSQPAVAGSIRVYVDGQEVPAGAGAWSYDAAENRIVFDAGATPPPGATVVIEYDAACL